MSVTVAQKYSKASLARLQAFETALRSLDQRKIDGDVVECGVWRGGHIILARLVSPQRRCWLYDTFSGMTAPGPHDVKRSGAIPSAKKALSKKWTACPIEQVIDNLERENVFDADRLRFVVGDVCETLRQTVNIPRRIAMLRLDTDWYESTKCELEILFPRIVPGGVLIIDDYGHWLGARKAVDEYLGERTRDLIEIDYTAVMLNL